jgi:hypothetical protein
MDDCLSTRGQTRLAEELKREIDAAAKEGVA